MPRGTASPKRVITIADVHEQVLTGVRLTVLLWLAVSLAGFAAPVGAQLAPTAAPAQPEQGPVSFVTWVDPTEHGFSVAVPHGWLVTGGTHWNGPTGARGFVRVQSPDGKVRAA